MDEQSKKEIWFARGGVRLFAVEQGAGQPVVFFHGGLADHRAALMLVQPLAAQHRLITPDLRGAGRSHDAGELGWDVWADDTLALLDALGLERAVVGGVSMGSGVALRFALRHAQRCAGLLLVSPVFAGHERGLDEPVRAALTRMDEVGQRVPSEGLAVLQPLFAPLPPTIRERALAMLASFDPVSVAATTRFLASGRQPFEDDEELASLRVPTLVVPGADPEHPRTVAEAYARAIPACRLLEPSERLPAQLSEFCGALG